MRGIRIGKVSKSYREAGGEVRAIDALDLTVGAGEFTVIAGPSGSGKTTLLNLVGGLDRPDTGEVFLDEYALQTMSDAELTELRLRRIGFVFQAFNLLPVLSVFENIQFILQIQGVAESDHAGRILPLLKELGLEGLENRFPPQLSGGQQQRVAVARAMIGRPRVVLADEPTANLDSENAMALLHLMKRLNAEQGVTFLFSSHDQRVIETARRVVRLRDGRIESDECRSGSETAQG
ncbi:MAG TPA: ABC transporter ATP-binding protein [Candidatus Ozemobacteraceae bacterium]|nr:ABC transporter ATP-binding protein [Candidatus Ozemobacteraceae bacterium]